MNKGLFLTIVRHFISVVALCLIMPFAASAQSAEGNVVSGTVLDATGYPVIGAAVLVKGTSQGASTDIDGKFTFELPAGTGADAVLEVSCLGYKTVELPLGSRRVFDITMEDDAILMEGTVVTALGIKRSEKALSYNVQKVDADEILANKDANFVNSLNGKVAGLVINASSSGVGGASKVVMRGSKSISKSNNAIYVIDGVPMTSTIQDAGTEFSSTGQVDPVADLNPEDIESISVLKDASSAAIYGAKAAFGVILITTKQGKDGKAHVDYNGRFTFHSPAVRTDFETRGYYSAAMVDYFSRQLKGQNFTNYDDEDYYHPCPV